MRPGQHASSLLYGACLLLMLCCSGTTKAQTFPCPDLDSDAASVPGGYSNINPDELEENGQNLLGVILGTNASFFQWVDTDGNFTACNDTADLGRIRFGVLQVCSQVVAGTNYGIKYLADYNCEVDEDSLAANRLILNAVVYVPLAAEGERPEPEVQSVWQDTDYPVAQLEVDVVEVPVQAPAEMTAAAPPPMGRLRSFGSADDPFNGGELGA